MNIHSGYSFFATFTRLNVGYRHFVSYDKNAKILTVAEMAMLVEIEDGLSIFRSRPILHFLLKMTNYSQVLLSRSGLYSYYTSFNTTLCDFSHKSFNTPTSQVFTTHVAHAMPKIRQSPKAHCHHGDPTPSLALCYDNAGGFV